MGIEVIFYAFKTYLRTNSLIHLEVYFISLQIPPNPVSLFSFSLKIAWKELGKIMRVEQVSNANHKANSLAAQYYSKNSFILCITTVTASSNQQSPHLKASMCLSNTMDAHIWHQERVCSEHLEVQGKGFNPPCCTRAGELWTTLQHLTCLRQG